MPLNTIPNKGLTSRGYPSDRLVTPIIINGDMSVAQRGTSGSGFGPSKTGYQLDRFSFRKVGGDSAVFTISQDTDVPSGQGFANSMKIDCTTALADGSIPSSQWVRIRYRIEGQDLQLIKKGTSSAETLTMCFWVKSPKTGTHIVSIYDDDNVRLIAKSYTVSSANTWEKKTIVFEGDTTGTLDNDNNSSFRVEWHLQSGADYQSGSLGTTWHAFDSTKTSVGQVNLGDNTANNFFLTGVQLEVGEFDSTTIPSFPFESFENNLRKCYRYTQKHPQKDTSGNYGIIAQGMADGSTLALCNINPLPVEMRTTASLSSSGSFRAHKPGGASSVSSIAINSDHVSSSTFAIRVTTSGITAGHSIFLEQNNDADAHVILDSEL